ncbi:hypothetical protein HQ563_03015 [bacterium]|nr:hypothetical protein [bacterium]
MRTRHAVARFGLFLAVAFHHAAVAEVILETGSLRLVIGEDGILRSLAAKPSGMEYGWTSEPGLVAMVYRGG